MKKYYFKIFGLNIVSDIFFPEFSDDSFLVPDISIRYGTVPINVLQAKINVANCQIGTNQCLIKISNIAHYFIENGTTIIIQPALKANEDAIRLYLTGLIMGILLHQRKLLVLHASAIVVGDSAIAFMAPSGRGKSTLAASFYQRGFPILADDICAIHINAHAYPIIHSGFPQIKLTKASLNKLAIPENSVNKLPSTKEKYSFLIKNNFLHFSKKLLHVYELFSANTETITLHSLTGIQKFSAIMQHTFSEWAIPALGLQATHFTLCSLLNNQIKISRVTRPLHYFKIDELTDFLLNDIHTNMRFVNHQ